MYTNINNSDNFFLLNAILLSLICILKTNYDCHLFIVCVGENYIWFLLGKNQTIFTNNNISG